MTRTKEELWERFKKHYKEFTGVGLAMDLSRVNFGDDYFEAMAGLMQMAFAAMSELEHGAIANPDEKRMVGHYWLRNPALAPRKEIRAEIEETVASIKAFAADIHSGKIRGNNGAFKRLLLFGIGGSSLGLQFVLHASSNPLTDKLEPFFFDNTDPDGMDQVLTAIG